MGQFKPMVKMFTTEPSVELKLKKGGHVNMKKGGSAKSESGHKPMHHMMDGGVMGALASTPALVGRPAVNAPVRTPGKPPMAMRRKAMAPVRPAGMMKEGGESKAEHKSEMKAIKGLKSELKSHEGKPASKGHKGLKDGGAAGDAAQTKTTVKGNAGKFANTEMHGTPKGKTSGTTGAVKEGNAGGYKRGGKVKMSVGGNVPSESSYGDYASTKVYSAKPDRASGTGGVKEEQGGYKRGGKVARKAAGGAMNYVDNNVVGTPPGVTNRTTGGVREGNAGGYKKGGSTKKAFATGGKVDSGRPVAMPQGRKPASKPVSNDRQSGTFKRGGKVGGYGTGGLSEIEDQMKTNEANRGYKNWEKSERAENEATREMILGAPRRMVNAVKGLFSPSKPAGSVTETQKSVTVSPAKKRGGKVC